MTVESAPVATAVGRRPMPRRVWPERVFRQGQWVSIHSWTEEDDALLRREYRYTLQSLKDLAVKVGATKDSVRQRLTRLGLLKLTVLKWTPEEEKFLEENYSRLSPLVISRRLHKSANAVVGKAHRLRVTNKVRDGWFTLGEVAQILGVDPGWIMRRLNNGFKLQMEPHDPERYPRKGNHAAWHISEKSLRDFIRRYPEELTGRNVDFVMLVDILAGVKT